MGKIFIPGFYKLYYGLYQGLEFWKVASMSLIGVIPVVTLASLISRYPVRGLALGAIKE